MEQGQEITAKIEEVRSSFLKSSDVMPLYIPLQGKRTINPEENPFDLAEKIYSFFEFKEDTQCNPKVMLLLGDAGSGKSVFSQQLHKQLWKDYKAGYPIPLWVPLPELDQPFECAVEEVLIKCGFNESQITNMKANQRFIFVVDGYDELHQFQNCYVTNKWSTWNAKVLITCRSQALYYQKDPDKYFMPFNGEKPLPMLLRKLYVAPFSKEQISAYVKQYQQINTDNTITEEDFSKVPGLLELITTPFLLHLAMDSLPDLLAQQEHEKHNALMTQAALYDVFIEQWFTRQVAKLRETGHLKETDEDPKPKFWDYCKKLAQQMHEKEVSVIPYHGQKIGNYLFGKNEQKNHWEIFFNEDKKLIRSACPLRRFGDHYYGFVHSSMIGYFATRAMYEEIACQDMNNKDVPVENFKGGEITKTHHDQMPGGIHHRLFTQERHTIQFLADRIQMNEVFKRKLLAILEASKKSQRYAIGAANAITALVRGGVTFNGANLSRIMISGADISGGYFDQANFEGSDLTEVHIAHSWLRQSELNNCKLQGLIFGEYPWFEHEDEVTSMVYRPDINRLVTASGSSIFIWNIETGESIQELKEHTGKIISIALSQNGEKIVSGDNEDMVNIWEVPTGQSKSLGMHRCLNNVYLSGDGTTFGTARYDSTVIVQNLITGKAESLRMHRKGVKSIYLSMDGNIIVTGSLDYLVRVIDQANNRCITLSGHEGIVNCVQLSVDGKTIASGSDDGTVRIWNVVSSKAVVLKGHSGSVKSVSLSLDASTVASGSDDCTIRVWEIATGKAIILEVENKLTSVQLSPDEKKVAAACIDGTVRILDVSSGMSMQQRKGHTENVNSVCVSNDGNRVVSSSNDHTICIWDVRGQGKLLFKDNMDYICTSLSHDGKTVASGCGSYMKDFDHYPIRVFDIESGQAKMLLGHENNVNSVHLSEDGKSVVSGSTDHTVRVWDVFSGKCVVLRGHEVGVNSVYLSRDCQSVVSGSGISADEIFLERKYDETVQVLDMRSKKLTKNLSEYEMRNKGIHFNEETKSRTSTKGSKKEQTWLVPYKDNSVRVWNVKTGRAKVLVGHETCVNSVCLSVDGKTVVSGSDDSTVRVWKIRSGKSIILRHKGSVINAHLTASGKQVVSTSSNIVHVWDIKSKTCTATFDLYSVSCISINFTSDYIAIGSIEGTVQLFKGINEQRYNCQLKWSSNYPNSVLRLTDCCVKDSSGLSSSNKRLIEERGAKVCMATESTLASVAKRTNSPLYNNDSNNILDSNAHKKTFKF